MRRLLAILALTALLPLAGHADDLPTVRVAFAKCAHCTPIALMPEHAQGVRIEVIPFNTGSDAMTALVTHNVDIAQSTYQSFVVAMDRGFDVVAVSGHVNGARRCCWATTCRWQPRIGQS